MIGRTSLEYNLIKHIIIKLDFFVSPSEEDLPCLPLNLCTNDATMETQQQQSKVGYKPVCPAGAAVLKRCLNHVVH